jgi:hypothetical protein
MSIEVGLHFLPRGPSIVTTGLSDVAVCLPYRTGGGGVMVKFTSGGMDRGAFPICDWDVADAENDREDTV